MSFAINEAVTSVLHAALDGLATRQKVTADNIANVDTPGYRASAVDFESSLRSMIGSGAMSAGGPSITTAATDTPVGANGNNVDLRKETMAAMQSLYQYQIMTRAVTDQFDLVKTAAGGQ